MLSCSDRLPTALYRADEVRALDRDVIEGHGVPGIQLMARASRALFAALESQWSGCRQLQVFCGKGNNAGDAYLLSALAQERGFSVMLWQVGEPDLRGDALTAYQRALEVKVPMRRWQGEVPGDGVIVDGLLGTGLKGEVRPAFAEAIDAINKSGLPVLAVDIPSGLSADTGCALGCAVRAEVTATFIGLKRGLFTGDAADYCGRILFSGLEAPADIYAQRPASVRRLELDDELAVLGRRARTAHKGRYGHVLVVGGDSGMAGAALLASSAAGRCGAGLVSCATRADNVGAIVSARPEVMARGIEDGRALAVMIERATTLVLGPGLGRGQWGRDMFAAVAAAGLPTVIDADGLNLLAEMNVELPANVILTPHPGEAARLLGCSTGEINRDRFAAAEELKQRFGATVVLKGAGTLIAGGQTLGVSTYGNPGMASGGMGDVLSGILGGLLAQGLSPGQAARLGVCVHGAAADRAARDGERGLLAGDVIDNLRAVLNP